MPEPHATLLDRDDPDAPRGAALWLIAVVLLVAAAREMEPILAPVAGGVVLAIALTPLARGLERKGFGRGLASLVCTLAVGAFFSAILALVLYQAGVIVGDSDKYLQSLDKMLNGLSRRFRGGGHPVHLETSLQRGFSGLGDWVMQGVGGLLGLVGGGIVFLAFLFYVLNGRDDWARRLVDAAKQLGLKPGTKEIECVRHQLSMYLGMLGMVASFYAVTVSLLLWLIGVPYAVLWGVLAGSLELIPYFGPIVASILPTIMALSLGTLWQPAATAGMFLLLHIVEGYFVEPILYGRAVRLEPVTVLFGALFFGWLWGPVGLAIATPLVVILRGLLVITPETPTLEALADVKSEKTEAGTSATPPFTRARSAP